MQGTRRGCSKVCLEVRAVFPDEHPSRLILSPHPLSCPPPVMGLIREEIEYGIPANRIVVAGFSQGRDKAPSIRLANYLNLFTTSHLSSPLPPQVVRSLF